MFLLLFVATTVLYLNFRECDSLITENNPDRLLLEVFDIELTSVGAQTPTKGSMTISVSFKSSLDVTSVWFVDRDMPVIAGDQNFIPFLMEMKPFYTAQLVSTLNHDVLKSKDIRLQLTADGKSLYIDINTTNAHKVQKQSFSRMKYRQIVELNGKDLNMPTPLFDIGSNVQADKLNFYHISRTIDSYGGGEVLSRSKIDLSNTFAISTVIENPETEVAMTYLQIGYSTGLVSNLVLGIQINPSRTPTALPQGTFKFQRGSIYYKDLNTGTGVDGKLYRCSAVGNVQLQILIDNEGTYRNGTDLPHIYVENGIERDLYVVRRPKESCTPAVFCQAFYRYKDSKTLSEISHQLPPRYSP